MKSKWHLIIVSILLLQCSDESPNYKALLGVDILPNEHPIFFKKELVPNGKLIHRGILNPQLDAYYFTLSNKDFSDFDIYIIERKEGKWSEPQKAFFNSEYDDHGMSFSPDGKRIYFSSTRPIIGKDLPETWHLWRTNNNNGTWTEPEYVDIPNMRDKLISHPSISENGTLYFHASNLDYSKMDIYHSVQEEGKFKDAEKTYLSDSNTYGRTTPYVSADGSFLIYAAINKTLDLMICQKDEKGKWSQAKAFNKAVNTNGQGNPYITPDNKFLFFAVEENNKWKVKWVDVESLVKNQ
ncbi:hypothetical protein VC82_1765 [Flagellimonas lutaonensis]|uniref:WD40-like beta Propeller containing protein n=2 Tax=Flagellimonas lutaonensis TaxID=516051 RepID=A0A0D5YSY8_9FLAO|nr:hypothetical protein VC82_1765 [Allomuricauda lutaonensis]